MQPVSRVCELLSEYLGCAGTPLWKQDAFARATELMDPSFLRAGVTFGTLVSISCSMVLAATFTVSF